MKNNNGDTRTLIPVFKTTPEDAAGDTSCTWVSDNPSVATVDSNGKVTAKGLGSVTITATSKKEFKNGKKSASITLNVVTFSFYILYLLDFIS